MQVFTFNVTKNRKRRTLVLSADFVLKQTRSVCFCFDHFGDLLNIYKPHRQNAYRLMFLFLSPPSAVTGINFGF